MPYQLPVAVAVSTIDPWPPWRNLVGLKITRYRKVVCARGDFCAPMPDMLAGISTET
jgi:hypothetical protein